jgi:hypothetical protein
LKDSTDGAEEQALKSLEADAQKILGKEETRKVFATLGPESAAPGAAIQPRDCECSDISDYCPIFDWCKNQTELVCHHLPKACGMFYRYECNGTCV